MWGFVWGFVWGFDLINMQIHHVRSTFYEQIPPIITSSQPRSLPVSYTFT